MSFAKVLGGAISVFALSLTPVLAQTSSATGGGAEGSMSSVNGASEGGSMGKSGMMSKSGMMGKSGMMKKHHKSRHMMKHSGGM